MQAYAAIVEIVNKADSRVVLISPYISLPDDLLQRLKHKEKQGIKTVVVCKEREQGKDLASKVRRKLKELRNLDLRFDDDLHAKCFYNEKHMVITSLNLLESSKSKNREMGVLISSKEDGIAFSEALDEAEYIIGEARKDSRAKVLADKIVKLMKTEIRLTPGKTTAKVESSNGTEQKGYCIKCGKPKTYNQGEPYCSDCYRVWKKSKDPSAREEFCHFCGGRNESTTINKPLCNSCYNKSRAK
jgi:phosphatidylserine/phosphatidylglycerophosphate/cardiolipin synthase-like enzyme